MSEVLNSWNRAKNTRFVTSNSCPVSSTCVVVSIKKLPRGYFGVTYFYPTKIVIYFNTYIKTAYDAQATACHELGHVLGLGHITGTRKSCMPISSGINDPSRATDLDIHWADSLGPWNLERMDSLRQKTVDVRDLPR